MILSKATLNKIIPPIVDQHVFFSKRKELNDYDVFICYNWNDRFFAIKIVQLLEQCGYKVYIDSFDPQLNRLDVSKETSERLFSMMKKCKGLLYIYSHSSSVSKWCAWEIGVFSGRKNFRCANLPIVEKDNDEYKNQEYLELYPYIEYAPTDKTNQNEFWVCEDDDTYSSLKEWVNGKAPYRHKMS